ncbi:hypothetical protein SB776_34860, partial [Burkholderia sp. SIMBA_045]
AIQEDFGDGTLTRLLNAGEEPRPLYELATDVLIELHRRFPVEEAACLNLPLYDAALFAQQVALFADVYLPAATGKPLSDEARSDFDAAWAAVVPEACAGPQS